MLNNNFSIVGMVVSDFEDATFNEKYPKKKFLVEVPTKFKNTSKQYPIEIPDSNKSINTNVNLTGKAVIVNGYIDVSKGFLRLVGQDAYVIGDRLNNIDEEFIAPSGEKEMFDAIQDVKDVVKDGDLPF